MTELSTPYLVGHYIYNMWGAPWQDNQTWNKLARVTPFGGARNHVEVFHEDYQLPTKQDRYHAYMVGQVYEDIYNLPLLEWTERSTWIPMNEYCKQTGIVFNFYTQDGINVPLSHVFFTLTVEKNVIFIVKEDLKIQWDMNNSPLYFRTYRNALQRVDQRGLSQEKADVVYVKVKIASDKQKLVEFFNQYNGKPGAMLTYHNGYLVDNTNYLSNVLEGDIVEIIYDSTLIKAIEVKLGELPTFKSKADGIRKYLITHDKSYKDNVLEYLDDCDFYLCAYPKKTPLLFNGLLLHRNHVSNIRQVTNSDYSISTNLVSEYLIAHQDLFDEQIANLTFKVYYRKQFGNKKMPYNANRIHELNRLPYVNRVAALQGLRSNIDEWRADNLENSPLMKLISKPKPICNLEEVQDAYGYNAATYYTGLSVHSHEEFISDGLGGYLVDVPYSYRKLVTVFEYDSEGKLLMWRRLENVNQYPVVNRDTKLVEFVSGIGTRQPEDHYGKLQVVVPEYQEHRVFACLKNLETHPEKWKDVTATDAWSYITDTDGLRNVLIKGNAEYSKEEYTFLIRTDKKFLCQDIEVDISRGLLQFTMNHHIAINGKVSGKRVEVPYGYLDVFLNGSALIEGIDYFVDFPNVVIINKGSINPFSMKQKITYRMMAFPATETINGETILTGIKTNRQVGYVNHYRVSRNKQYEIFEDKNFLIKIGNGIMDKSKVGFSEDNTEMKERKEYLEGKPYEIRDVVVPKRFTYPKDTYQFKRESDEVDRKVSNYLNQFIEEEPFSSNPAIIGKYEIFSPLLSKLLHDLEKKQVDFPMDRFFTNQELINYISTKYSPLFKVDPYYRKESISFKHVVIHPTHRRVVTTLNFHQARFFRRVVEVFYDNAIETSHFIRVSD